MKNYLELMAQRAEIFEITFGAEHVQLSSYTTGIYTSESTILRQPLNTQMIMRLDQIEALAVEENMSLGIRLKEFRVFISLLDSLSPQSLFEAYFFKAGYPMLFSLSDQAVISLPVQQLNPGGDSTGGGGPAKAVPRGIDISFVFLTTGPSTGSDIGTTSTTSHLPSDSDAIVESRNVSIIRRGISRAAAASDTMTTSGSTTTAAESIIGARSMSTVTDTDSLTSGGRNHNHNRRAYNFDGDDPSGSLTASGSMLVDSAHELNNNNNDDYEIQPSVRWNDNDDHELMAPDQTMHQQQPQPSTTESSLFVYQENDDEEEALDHELLTFASQLDAIGPTQNKSQAHGLFDD
ncbi:hypothetical protein AWJ20_4929 [Sugiyamaella lignohabitans]|uniref:Uncharacterized protein n=1 Tax=Sugiyamaella lignohabitans TaxID=796027 RepID=A0A167EEK7_9ASCO|nr:uncharacterized protein AWJ20_4929 [Sugiyamaella lignohabitans]ANB13976.1 hypothetical protein AWJ20_4929 [Sugiyamaella lignohabitans]